MRIMSEQLIGRVQDGQEGAADGPADTLQLHEISTLLIQEGSLHSLYDRILDVAFGFMVADMASIQVYKPERSALQLLAWRGFHAESATFWSWVNFDSCSSCGLAFSSGGRVIVPDTETCAFLASTTDLDEYRRSNIRAVQSTPLISRSGQLLGMISTHWREPHQPAERALQRLDVLARQSADLIERGNMEAALRESEQQSRWLASIVESSNDAIVSKNLDGTITSWNKGAARMFGYAVDEAIGKPITILIPTDRHDEERAILERIRRGERVDHYEAVRLRKDGSLIVISLTVSPVKNAEGKIIGASKIARDITERKRNEEQTAALAREAEHRTNNVLATVQATIDLSLSEAPEDLKEAIKGRIQALSNVHTLFVESRWLGADLHSLVTQELRPYRRDDGVRVQIDGPELSLESDRAQTIAMALHELATNAAKYGAFSTAEGRVEVKWSLVADGWLVLRWTESGGPLVMRPTRHGFGTRMMEEMIRREGGCEVRFDWRPDGLVCEISIRTRGGSVSPHENERT
jgi:PAS domain S-box-containing protein